MRIQAYVAVKLISEVKRELGFENVFKLASNESSLGCSPNVNFEENTGKIFMCK